MNSLNFYTSMNKFLLILTVAPLLATTALSANLALSGTYSYEGSDRLPGFNGTTTGFYIDSGHTGYTDIVNFDSGELNDGVIITTGSPTEAAQDASFAAWNPLGTASQITFDLGSLFNISSVTLNSYIYTAFAVGAPDSFEVEFSTDGTIYTGSSIVPTGFTYTDGDQSVTENVSQAAQFVRFQIAGNSPGGDKYSITEIGIEGTPIPEPSSTILLGLAGLLGLTRRRR